MIDNLLSADDQHATAEVSRILERVRRELWEHEPLREAGSILRIRCDGGVVRLTGRVRTLALKFVAGYLALSVAGTTDVENDIVSDPEVISAVADALAADPVTRPHVLRVDSRLGRAKLSGIVPSASVEQKALEVAAALPVVTSVISEIEIDPRAMEPGAGVVVGNTSRASRAGGA